MRPRKTDRHLPSCVYSKHGSYYYVKDGKWTRLGDDLSTALAAYGRLTNRPREKMPGLLWRWLDDATLAATTRATYTVYVRKLEQILVEFEPHELTARDITALMYHERKRPAIANIYRNILIGALEHGFMENLVERNVARDTRPLKTPTRDRLISDAEYDAISAHASPTMRAIMDMLYFTGQRISDVLKIKLADIQDDALFVRQKKTGNRVKITMTDELRAAVATAKALHQSVRGMTLFHTRQGKPLSYSTVRTLWLRATTAADVPDARMHDLRAKAGTDAEAQGLDSKKLLGHTSEQSHKRYLRSKEIPIAIPATRRKAK